jgi:DNA-directed RNA polymerase specialized sigma24 family protein
MSSMSENDRAAYTLRFVEGLELSEIAEALQVSLSTVRRAIRRATEQVDRMIRDETTTAWEPTRPRTGRSGVRRTPASTTRTLS